MAAGPAPQETSRLSDSPDRPRSERPTAQGSDFQEPEDRIYYGIEYVILALLLVVGVFFFSPRAQRLLEVLYDPYFILLILVIFAEYIILKARDRSYIFERELALQRGKRQEQQAFLDETERTLRKVREVLSRADEIGMKEEERQDLERQVASLLDRLERRV